MVVMVVMMMVVIVNDVIVVHLVMSNASGLVQISFFHFLQSITRTQDQGTPRKTPRKTLLTPRSSRRYESPAGPMSVRTTNFVHLASVHLDKNRVTSDAFTLEKVGDDYIMLIGFAN